MKKSNPIFVLGFAIAIAGGWAGCGGGGAEGGGAVDENGNVIRTAGGAAVSEAAHNFWTEAIAMFQRHETSETGWNEQACTTTSAKFEEANAAQGNSFTEAIYMLGVVAGRCGNDEAALGFYQRALQANERYCGARVGVGLADLRAGRTAPARQHFERAIRDDNQCTSAYVNLAIIQRQSESEVREALNNLRRALAIESDYLPAFNQMALLYFNQAESNRQMLDLAEVVCRQAQLINGNYAPIYNTWGLINARQGNIIAALAKFQRAFALDPDFFEAYMNFGQLTLGFRGYEDAQGAFTQARRLRGQDYDATIGLGAAQRGLTMFDEAEASYRAAIEIDAQRPEAYFNLGLLYQDFKGGQPADLQRATQFYEQFTQRAGTQRTFADAVEAVSRTCRRRPQRPNTGGGGASTSRRARRQREGRSEWVGDCRPGRVQQIAESIRLQVELSEMTAEMQRMQEQQRQRELEQEQRELQEQQQQQPPEGGGAAQ